MEIRTIISTAVIGLAISSGLAGCGSLQSLPFSAPQLAESDSAPHPDVLTTFRLSRIDIAEDEACPFDSDGKLLVFSETVYADAAGKSLTLGNKVIEVGQDFTGSLSRDLPEGYQCGGNILPAKHVINAQIAAK